MRRVRDAEPGDAEALARLCGQLGYPARAAEMPERLSRIRADINAKVLVAENRGSPAGLITVHLRYTMNHAAPLAQITLLVVDESRRTAGVGRVLVTAAEEWARERGCGRIVVTTALARAGAHAFYERVGYAHTGRRYGKDFPMEPST